MFRLLLKGWRVLHVCLLYTLWIWECRSLVMTCSCPRLMSLMSPRLRFLFIKPSLMWGRCGSCEWKYHTVSYRQKNRVRLVKVALCTFLPWTANSNLFVNASGLEEGGWHYCHLGLTRIIKLLLPDWHPLLRTCLSGSLLAVLNSLFFVFGFFKHTKRILKILWNCNLKVEEVQNATTRV